MAANVLGRLYVPQRVTSDGATVHTSPAGEITVYNQSSPRAMAIKLFGDGRDNDIVAILTAWIGETAPAPVQLFNGEEEVQEHRFLDLMDKPAEGMDYFMFQSEIYDELDYGGNAYIQKIRRNQVVSELRIHDYRLMAPLEKNGKLTGYGLYNDLAKRGEPKRIPVNDIIHIRLRRSNSKYLGRPPFDPVLGLLYLDYLATKRGIASFKNGIAIGVLISPREMPGNAKEALEEARNATSRLRERYSGDNFGSPLVMSVPAQAETLADDLTKTDTTPFRFVVESRASAAVGVQPVTVGFLVGLEHGSSYASADVARRVSYERAIIPKQKLFAAALRMQLLNELEPSFGKAWQVRFDNTGHSFLQAVEDNMLDAADIDESEQPTRQRIRDSEAAEQTPPNDAPTGE